MHVHSSVPTEGRNKRGPQSLGERAVYAVAGIWDTRLGFLPQCLASCHTCDMQSMQSGGEDCSQVTVMYGRLECQGKGVCWGLARVGAKPELINGKFQKCCPHYLPCKALYKTGHMRPQKDSKPALCTDLKCQTGRCARFPMFFLCICGDTQT